MRTEKITEAVKTAVLLVLLVAAVCMCVIYMLSYQGAAPYGFTREAMETLDGASIKYQYLKYYDAAYAAPCFIGISSRRLGENIGFLYNEKTEGVLYADVLRFYEKLFGAEGTTEQMTTAEGEAAFSDIMEGDYLYLSYFCDLPKSLIMAMAEPENVFSGMSGEYIKEIFLVPDRYLRDGVSVSSSGVSLYTAIYSFYAVARDSAGNYYRYTTSYVPEREEDVSFNTNYYLTYTTLRSALRYEFAPMLSEDAFLKAHGFSEKVTDTTAVIVGGVSAPVLSVEAGALDDDSVNAYLTALLMNPERVSSYTDENGVRFYFDEGRNVRISPDGSLRYTALGSEGIALADLFGYRPSDGRYDAFDYIGAALMVASSLDHAPSGADVTPRLYLSGVGYDGRVLTVRFGYQLDGVPLFMDGKADVLTFELYDGMIKSVSFDLWQPHVTTQTAALADMMWTIRAHIMDTELRHAYAPAYRFGAEKRESGMETAAFVFGAGEGSVS